MWCVSFYHSDESEPAEVPQLPRHVRCAAHTLNLVGASDVPKLLWSEDQVLSQVAIQSAARRSGSGTGSQLSREENELFKYNKYHLAVTKKMKEMWKAQRFSALAAEKILQHVGLKFVLHNKTRWNSEYEAVRRIVLLAEKDKSAFDALCIELKVAVFNEVEIKFLKEYMQVNNVLHFLQTNGCEEKTG
jgi:hypothetical protein